MALRSHGLRDAFEAQGEAGFMAWTYGTYDPLETVLRPGYFNGFGRFKPGDLLYVGTSPRPESSPWATQHTGSDIRRALLMVRGKDDQGRTLVRLVQDYGGPDDGDAPMGSPLPPVKRGRGRPPKEV